jgi:hypothetical protein
MRFLENKFSSTGFPEPFGCRSICFYFRHVTQSPLNLNKLSYFSYRPSYQIIAKVTETVVEEQLPFSHLIKNRWREQFLFNAHATLNKLSLDKTLSEDNGKEHLYCLAMVLLLG